MQWGQTAAEDLGKDPGRLTNGLRFFASRPAEVIMNHPVFRPPYCTYLFIAEPALAAITSPSAVVPHPPPFPSRPTD